MFLKALKHLLTPNPTISIISIHNSLSKKWQQDESPLSKTFPGSNATCWYTWAVGKGRGSERKRMFHFWDFFLSTGSGLKQTVPDSFLTFWSDNLSLVETCGYSSLQRTIPVVKTQKLMPWTTGTVMPFGGKGLRRIKGRTWQQKGRFWRNTIRRMQEISSIQERQWM